MMQMKALFEEMTDRIQAKAWDQTLKLQGILQKANRRTV